MSLAVFQGNMEGGTLLIELFYIEQLESELQILYSKLEHTTDERERNRLQEEIQARNLRLVRFMPNE
jgi:hypothetical protein